MPGAGMPGRPWAAALPSPVATPELCPGCHQQHPTHPPPRLTSRPRPGPPVPCAAPRADGQRRRVQIARGLLKPFRVLLLDEITVDLDVLGRADLMAFLREECRQRGATIVYVSGA